MIADTINAMQTIHGAIDGVTWAPPLAEYPGSLQAAQLPMVMAWPTGGTWDEAAIGLHRNEIEFQVTAFIEAVANGYRGDTIIAAVGLMDSFRMVYLDYETIQTVGGTVEQISAVTLSGLREITFAGIAYYGFMLTFTATLKETP